MKENEEKNKIIVAVFSGGSVSSEEFDSLEQARERHPGKALQRLRVCKVCKHAECPCCGVGTCDVLDVIEGGDGRAVDVDVCCDGHCTYDEFEKEPYEYQEPSV